MRLILFSLLLALANMAYAQNACLDIFKELQGPPLRWIPSDEIAGTVLPLLLHRQDVDYSRTIKPAFTDETSKAIFDGKIYDVSGQPVKLTFYLNQKDSVDLGTGTVEFFSKSSPIYSKIPVAFRSYSSLSPVSNAQRFARYQGIAQLESGLSWMIYVDIEEVNAEAGGMGPARWQRTGRAVLSAAPMDRR